jgi:hypothetical protein
MLGIWSSNFSIQQRSLSGWACLAILVVPVPLSVMKGDRTPTLGSNAVSRAMETYRAVANCTKTKGNCDEAQCFDQRG